MVYHSDVMTIILHPLVHIPLNHWVHCPISKLPTAFLAWQHVVIQEQAALSSCWKIILCVVVQRLIKSAVQLRAHILQSRWQARFHPEISENLERPKSGVFHKIVIDIFLFGSSFKQY